MLNCCCTYWSATKQRNFMKQWWSNGSWINVSQRCSGYDKKKSVCLYWTQMPLLLGKMSMFYFVLKWEQMSLFQEGKFMLLNLLLNNFVPSSRMAARIYKGSSTVPVQQLFNNSESCAEISRKMSVGLPCSAKRVRNCLGDELVLHKSRGIGHQSSLLSFARQENPRPSLHTVLQSRTLKLKQSWASSFH